MNLLNEKGEVIACPLCCLIHLPNGHVTYIDPDDWVWINRTGWRRDKTRNTKQVNKTIKHQGKQITVSLHRLVADTPPDQVCHHKNKNVYDNRKANLANMSHYEHKLIHRTGYAKLLTPKLNRELLISVALAKPQPVQKDNRYYTNQPDPTKHVGKPRTVKINETHKQRSRRYKRRRSSRDHPTQKTLFD